MKDKDGWFNLHDDNYDQREHPKWKDNPITTGVTFDFRCAKCKIIFAENISLKVDLYPLLVQHRKESCQDPITIRAREMVNIELSSLEKGSKELARFIQLATEIKQLLKNEDLGT